MKVITIAIIYLIHFSTMYFAQSYVIIHPDTSTLFSHKVPRIFHRTLRHMKRFNNITMLFITNTPASKIKQIKWRNKARTSSNLATYSTNEIIENVIETQGDDTLTPLLTTDLLELLDFKPEWFESTKRSFDHRYLNTSTTIQIILNSTSPKPFNEHDDYFIEAWPTFTTMASMYLPFQTKTKTNEMKYRTLFEATTLKSIRARKLSVKAIINKYLIKANQSNQMLNPAFAMNRDVGTKISNMKIQRNVPTPFMSTKATYYSYDQNYQDSSNYLLNIFDKKIGRSDNDKLIAKCYSCGWHQRDIPQQQGCFHVFDSVEPMLRGKKGYFRSHCFGNTSTLRSGDVPFEVDYRNNIIFLPDDTYGSINSFVHQRNKGVFRGDTTENIDDPLNLKEIHRKYRMQFSTTFIGGCFKRFTDVGSEVYYEKGCRKWPPVRGKSFASRRFAKVEKMLQGKAEGCVASPHASLTAFSRGVYLWVRYHVCVCQGHYCNAQSSIQWSYHLSFIILVFNLVNNYVNIKYAF